MSKVRDISNLSNVIRTDASGNVSFVSGSTTLATINTSGQLSGSSPVLSSSYALNADLLDGLDSTQFTLTSSFAAQTASFTAFTASVNSFTASQLVLNGTYATTGSNTFAGIQTINSNLVVTGSITAQTLVVQTITSSVDFVTGSTRFGSILGNTHVFSGSVTMNPNGLFVSSSGTVGIGTTTDAGYKLDVNGTARINGSALFNGNSEINVNHNSLTRLLVRNTTAGTGAYVETSYQVDSSGGAGAIGKYSSSTSTYKIIPASSTYLYNSGAGDISILNDFSSGAIRLAAGGSSTSHFTIASTGAATFSSTIGTSGDITITKASDTSFIANNTSASGKSYRLISKDDGKFYIQNTGVADLFNITSLGVSTFISDIVLSAANPFIYGGTAAGSVGISNVGGQTYIKTYGASHATLANVTQFVNGSSTSLSISSTGVSTFSGNVLPGSNNTYNLGSSSNAWANIYTNDLHLSNINKSEGNDIDGTSGTWTIQEGADDLYIINNLNNKRFKIKLQEII
jgi:hypothetical protein